MADVHDHGRIVQRRRLRLGLWAQGGELVVNHVDVVDFDAESSLVRGTTWLNLYSPRIDTYDLSLAAGPVGGSIESSAVLLSWMGLPGSGFGGMNGTIGAVPLFATPYGFSPRLDRMEHVPIAIWSSKALMVRWHAEGQPPVEANLSDRGKLVGTLTSHLDVPLADAVLLYDRWAYPMRELRPGQRVDIESQLDPQTVDTYLRHVTVEGDRNVAPPYNRASFDVPRIIEVMSAFQLAGGEDYTGLSNNYQDFIDISTLVRDGRAVLFGRARGSATQLQREGRELAGADDQHWVFYRCVFPVAERGRGDAATAQRLGSATE